MADTNMVEFLDREIATLTAQREQAQNAFHNLSGKIEANQRAKAALIALATQAAAEAAKAAAAGPVEKAHPRVDAPRTGTAKKTRTAKKSG